MWLAEAVEVCPVRTPSDMKLFLDLPFLLHGQQPLWVPQLKMIQREQLDEARHPYWRQAKRTLFLARKNGRVVGRIAAIADHALDRQQGHAVGAWGFFECENDRGTAMVLFDAVEAWHKSRSDARVSFLRGPLNPSLNYTCGMLISGFDCHQPFLMPWTPPHYPVLAEGCGMHKEQDLLCYRFFRQSASNAPMAQIAEQNDLAGTYRVRHSTRATFERDIVILTDLFNRCWEENWGFSPIPLIEMRHMLQEIRLLPGCVHMILFESDDVPVAVSLVLRDLSGLLRRTRGRIGPAVPWHLWRGLQDRRGGRLFLLGVLKEYRSGAVPLLLMREILSMAHERRRLEYLDGGWTIEDNDDVNDLCEQMGGKLITRHRIYRREIVRD
jgi:GNAT superfamily N-acetyltransferase